MYHKAFVKCQLYDNCLVLQLSAGTILESVLVGEFMTLQINDCKGGM